MRRPELLSFAIAALGGCGANVASTLPAEGSSEDRVALRVYDCREGLALLVRGVPEGEAIEVEWGDRRLTLERVPSEGRAVYAADGARLEEEEGDTLTFVAPGAEPQPCRHGQRAETIERASAEGATVWAVGNEPGFMLELHPDRFVFESDYGVRRYRGTVAGTSQDGPSRRYVGHAGGHEIVVRVTPRLCNDGMSGAPFGAEVIVTRESDEYRGCGLLLAR